MSKFRTRSSHRRARKPTASWIVAGPRGARAISRGDITMHVRPVRSGDHAKRYQPGMRLAVKMCVGIKGMSDTLCRVHVLQVQGPRDQMTAGQIGFAEARMLGHRTTDEFRVAWVAEYDQDWTGDDPLARFDARWAGKLIWAVRFEVDIAEAPRLLAVRSDELYVENEAMALRGEMPALSEADYKRHVQDRRDMTSAQWVALEHRTRQAEIQALSLGERLDRAIRENRENGRSTTREVRVIEQRLLALEQQIRRPAA
jgi:hypothetical protein